MQHIAKALHSLTLYTKKKLVFRYRGSNRPDKNRFRVSEVFLHKTCSHPVCYHVVGVRCISSVKSAWLWHLTAGGNGHLWDVHQKNGVTFFTFLLHIVFYSKYKLAWQIDGMGEEQGRGGVGASLGRKELSGWNGKFPMSWSLKYHSGWSCCLNKSEVRYSEFGSNQLSQRNPAFPRCWLSAAPRGPHGIWAAQHFSDWYY